MLGLCKSQRAVLCELVRDRRFRFSRRRADRELKKSRDRDVTQAFIGIVLGEYSTRSAEDVERAAHSAFFGSAGSTLSAGMRRWGVSETRKAFAQMQGVV
jgi:hypothetical protein